jgi:hypothetical protein
VKLTHELKLLALLPTIVLTKVIDFIKLEVLLVFIIQILIFNLTWSSLNNPHLIGNDVRLWH